MTRIGSQCQGGGTRWEWVVNAMPQLLCHQERDHNPFYRRLDVPWDHLWMAVEHLTPIRV